MIMMLVIQCNDAGDRITINNLFFKPVPDSIDFGSQVPIDHSWTFLSLLLLLLTRKNEVHYKMFWKALL